MEKIISKIMVFALVFTMFMPYSVTKASTEFETGKQTASLINYSTSYSGNLAEKNSSVWYCVDSVGYSAFYNFKLKNINIGNNEGISLNVYDSDGAKVGYAKADNSTETDNYVKMEKNQRYYIQAYSKFNCTGDYIFYIIPENDASDSLADASKISLSKYYYDSFRLGSDVDYFKFKTLSTTDYYRLTVKNINIGNNYSCFAQIFDSDGAEVTKHGVDSGKEWSTEDIKLGRNKLYTVKFTSYFSCVGDYKFVIKPVADAGSKKSQAVSVKLGKTYKYRINNTGDVDYYKFKLTKNGNYCFSLKDVDISGRNWDDLHMTVYNSSGKQVGTIITYKGKSTSKTLKNLKKGTYYVKISSPYEFSGTYTFRIKKK